MKVTNRPSYNWIDKMLVGVLVEQNTVEFHAAEQWRNVKHYIERLESRCYRASRILMEPDS